MAGDQRRPHRPARYPDLTELIDAANAVNPPPAQAETAAATAAVLVKEGRTPRDPAPFVELPDTVGLNTLAALWSDAEPASLPGVLWALYLLRQWCRTAGEEVSWLWRAGEPLAPADAAVAGVREPADEQAVVALADAVLTGLYQGDLAVALERAAAFFRVIAAGRRSVEADARLAERNDRAAAALAVAARRWRTGQLR